MLAWLMYGTLLWWVLTIIAVVVLFIFVEADHLGGAITEIVVYLVYLQLLGGIDVLEHITQNRLWALAYIVGYFVAGIIWSFVKWWLYLRKTLKHYKTVRLEWINERSQEKYDFYEDAPQDLKDKWKNNGPYQGKSTIVPKAANHKTAIANWIICWPMSLLWSMLSDIIIELGHKIVESLNKLYQSVVKSVYKDVQEDFETDLLK